MIRTEVNEIETRQTKEQMNDTELGFFEKVKKVDKI